MAWEKYFEFHGLYAVEGFVLAVVGLIVGIVLNFCREGMHEEITENELCNELQNIKVEKVNKKCSLKKQSKSLGRYNTKAKQKHW